jgi:hypothetical protein
MPSDIVEIFTNGDKFWLQPDHSLCGGRASKSYKFLVYYSTSALEKCIVDMLFRCFVPVQVKNL